MSPVWSISSAAFTSPCTMRCEGESSETEGLPYWKKNINTLNTEPYIFSRREISWDSVSPWLWDFGLSILGIFQRILHKLEDLKRKSRRCLGLLSKIYWRQASFFYLPWRALASTFACLLTHYSRGEGRYFDPPRPRVWPLDPPTSRPGGGGRDLGTKSEKLPRHPGGSTFCYKKSLIAKYYKRHTLPKQSTFCFNGLSVKNRYLSFFFFAFAEIYKKFSSQTSLHTNLLCKILVIFPFNILPSLSKLMIFSWS
jgi:hypothetical protein